MANVGSPVPKWTSTRTKGAASPRGARLKTVLTSFTCFTPSPPCERSTAVGGFTALPRAPPPAPTVRTGLRGP